MIINIIKQKMILKRMKKLQMNVHLTAEKMEAQNDTLVVDKLPIKELSKWYSKRIQEYEKIIVAAEEKENLKCICENKCCECCKQAIYINPVEYEIISKYIEQLGYAEKNQLKKQIEEKIEILRRANIPMKLDGSQAEQKQINEAFFSHNIYCPFLSEDRECKIYSIRPCVCWNYRNYYDKAECKKYFNPICSLALVDLDRSMTKEMYKYKDYRMKRQEYYLLIYAIGKMLFIC